MLPEWMKEVDMGPCKCSAIYHGKKGFVGKTIDGIFSFIQEAFISETYAKRNGLLQSLDPRAKLISILAVIFATSMIGDLNVLIFVYRLTLLFAYLSKIECRILHQAGLALHSHLCGHHRPAHDLQYLPCPGDPYFRLAYLGPGSPPGTIFTCPSQHLHHQARS